MRNFNNLCWIEKPLNYYYYMNLAIFMALKLSCKAIAIIINVNFVLLGRPYLKMMLIAITNGNAHQHSVSFWATDLIRDSTNLCLRLILGCAFCSACICAVNNRLIGVVGGNFAMNGAFPTDSSDGDDGNYECLLELAQIGCNNTFSDGSDTREQ